MTDHIANDDQSKPSIARIYDYLLGGTDNEPADREIGDLFIKELPGSPAIARANRQALIRAVGAMADAGIAQFVDLGSGLPTADNVHQVARRHNAEARVVYVDHDPVAVARSRALLDGDERTTVVQADLREPAGIHDDPAVRELIDFERPLGVIFSGVLHHLNDSERPADPVRWWADRVPGGSLFYISHFRSGENGEARVLEQKLQASLGRGRWRTDEEITALFGGLDVLEPGLVPCSLWRPDNAGPDGAGRPGADERELTVWEQLISCALARKA
ncbi:SAM-dependent methyltransferase [Kitasatospora viridis]|uniref:S-adenosyl methyltransferase n=1 Tax=Kitasatospora viridis TaxID=281105 RepID=A0A561SE12_9ACTN|nr:SAM-dependent methyltransferase [Kitasatospora viridis]TWF73075.1 S-adenosyl methyltransferase [Kitasatospora viridis]